MRDTHLAVVQHRWTGQRDSTKASVRDLVAQAASAGAELVLLPEFSISPYFPGKRDPSGFEWAESLTDGESVKFFNALAAEFNILLIGSLFEKAAGGEYYDTATLHSPQGTIIGITRKVHIPSGEGYHETDFFEGGGDYPLHDTGTLKLAAPTCYDQWFPELARIYALQGAELLAYPTAIGSEPTDPDFDSRDAWQTVMRGHAVANGVFVAAANRVGRENDVTFYGSSFICDPTGKVLAVAGRDEITVIHAVLQANIREKYHQLFPLLHQRKPEFYQPILQSAAVPLPQRWQKSPLTGKTHEDDTDKD